VPRRVEISPAAEVVVCPGSTQCIGVRNGAEMAERALKTGEHAADDHKRAAV
jgi:hypothetical protein